jgi:uncharacterized protein
MKVHLIISFVFVFMINLHGEFAPWNSNIKTGDALYPLHNENVKKEKLYNGAQCGAFFLVRFFQVVISPQDGPNCRHIPTCSAYAKRAVIKHGALAGSIMAGERLLRCNPFYPPERDPVPEKVFGK